MRGVVESMPATTSDRVKFLWEAFLLASSSSDSSVAAHHSIYCVRYVFCRSFYRWLRDCMGLEHSEAQRIATYARSSGIDGQVELDRVGGAHHA